MKVNRRDFVQIGTVGTVGVLGLGASCPHKGDETPSLQIKIQGLCIVERFPAAANVHLVDGNLVNLGPHATTLTVPSSLVDEKKTNVEYLTDTKRDMRVFDLTSKDMTIHRTGEETTTPPPADLTFDDGPIPPCATAGGEACFPADDHWTSLKFAAQLSTLCGSTTISPTSKSKFYGSLLLEHGHLQSAIPEDPDGRNYTWTFTRKVAGAPDQQIAQQALTDTLVCCVPSTMAGMTIKFEKDSSLQIVLKPGFPAVVTLKNLPPLNTHGDCKVTNPCLDHLEALYGLVDAQFTPTVVATLKPAPGVEYDPSGPGLRPNYCPPAI